MRIIKLITLILTFFIQNIAYNNIAYSSNLPVMIIRFNTPEIDIKEPIRKVVMASKAVKPNVFFDIVSVSPPQQNYLHSQTNTTKMVESYVRSFGVAANKIRTSYQKSPDINFKETHIFVR